MSRTEDTITAISTPVGRAGIGIIRISGNRASCIAQDIFRPRTPSQILKSHRLYLGHIIDPDSGAEIDEVLLSFMKGPRSYTREDVVEINSHSGYLLLSKILRIILSRGARLAEPGEFTLRAFLNGRIDLTQAEAVMDLINSQSERGLRLAARQVQGAFRDAVDAVRQAAADILAQVEVVIDFPEEEAAVISREQTADRISRELTGPVTDLIRMHGKKRLWVDGVKTVIVGRVNVGKSSLLNRLLDEQRAIVTAMPGTTRDIIQSAVTVEGIPLCLVDTAGFGDARNEAEAMGIHLSEQQLSQADFVMVVLDQSRPLSHTDRTLVRRARKHNGLLVLNKIDLPGRISREEEQTLSAETPLVRVSALTGEGMDGLQRAVVDSILGSDLDTTPSHAAPNLRHRQALQETSTFFDRASVKMREGAPMEIVAVELRSGLDALGGIIGETAGEEILDRIFSRFCLGK